MWCTQECWCCRDTSCEHYSNGLSEDEHALVVANVELKWLGKTTPDGTKIVAVDVDYRKDHQHMNRVMDEYGNMFFISELVNNCEERETTRDN